MCLCVLVFCFFDAVLGQGSMQQIMWWAERTLKFQMIGSYAQVWGICDTSVPFFAQALTLV